jgi:hypothetical protein
VRNARSFTLTPNQIWTTARWCATVAGTLGWVSRKTSTMSDQKERQNKIKAEFYDSYPLCFPKEPRCGLYIGEGWYPLVKKLCAEIQAELGKLPENLRLFQVDQIKEKFAGLRFYYTGPNPEEDVLPDVEPSEEVICKIAHERWEWRVKGTPDCPRKEPIAGSAENDWLEAERIAQIHATLDSYPQELKYARQKIEALVNDAESTSFKICDECGAPGTVRGDGWIRTQCDACEKEAKRQRALDDRKHIIHRRAWKNAGTDGNEIDWRDWQALSEEKQIAFMEEAEKQLLKEGGIKSVDRY